MFNVKRRFVFELLIYYTIFVFLILIENCFVVSSVPYKTKKTSNFVTSIGLTPCRHFSLSTFYISHDDERLPLPTRPPLTTPHSFRLSFTDSRPIQVHVLLLPTKGGPPKLRPLPTDR